MDMPVLGISIVEGGRSLRQADGRSAERLADVEGCGARRDQGLGKQGRMQMRLHGYESSHLAWRDADLRTVTALPQALLRRKMATASFSRLSSDMQTAKNRCAAWSGRRWKQTRKMKFTIAIEPGMRAHGETRSSVLNKAALEAMRRA